MSLAGVIVALVVGAAAGSKSTPASRLQREAVLADQATHILSPTDGLTDEARRRLTAETSDAEPLAFRSDGTFK